MKMPDITILMATYNAAAELPGALDSLERVAPSATLMIRDGNSQDATVSLLQERDHQITRWESAPDKGIYDAFLKALEWVQTPLVYFLGADDRLTEEWPRMVEALQSAYDISYGNVRRTRTGTTYMGGLSPNTLARTNLCQQAVFYPTELIREHPFDCRYPLQADWEFNMWCASESGRSFTYYPYCICEFNDTTGRSSTEYDETFNREYPQLVRTYFGPLAWVRYGLPALAAHHTRRLRKKA